MRPIKAQYLRENLLAIIKETASKEPSLFISFNIYYSTIRLTVITGPVYVAPVIAIPIPSLTA